VEFKFVSKPVGRIEQIGANCKKRNEPDEDEWLREKFIMNI
jgi:hypothetical protein